VPPVKAALGKKLFPLYKLHVQEVLYSILSIPSSTEFETAGTFSKFSVKSPFIHSHLLITGRDGVTVSIFQPEG